MYDGRVLVKITEGNKRFGMSEEIPYAGAKPMFTIVSSAKEIYGEGYKAHDDEEL